MNPTVSITLVGQYLELSFKYDSYIINAIKKVGRGQWKPDLKKWVFPIEKMTDLKATLEQHKINFQIHNAKQKDMFGKAFNDPNYSEPNSGFISDEELGWDGLSVSLTLVGKGDIGINFDYNKRFANYLKNKIGCKWNGKIWCLSYQRLEQFKKTLSDNNIPFTQNKELEIKEGNYNGQSFDDANPEALLIEEINRDTHASNAHDDISFDEKSLKLNGELLPYQRGGVSYIVKKGGRALLADDMGLGKTIQGIATMQYYRKDWPVFIIAPASLLLNWKKEILKWLPDLKEDDVFVITKGFKTRNKKKVAVKPKGKITISSFDYAHKQKSEIIHYLGVAGILLVDESHNIKNPVAKRTEAIIAISHLAKRVLMISGTPFLNRPIELFTQLNALNPVEWDNYWEYAKRYCDAKKTQFGMDVSGATNLKELYSRIRENLMVRRLKNEVLTQLPEKRRVTLTIETKKSMANNSDKMANELIDHIKKLLIENNGHTRAVKRKLYEERSLELKEEALEVYRLAGMAKVLALSEWLIEEINGGLNKIIVFGHHTTFLDHIQDSLEKSNINFMRIDGTTPKETRQEGVENFQNNKNCTVALLSITAASVGLTLTAASDVLMGELPWTPGLARQAEDRAHRIGQENSVLIRYAIGTGTIDGALWNMLSRKSAIASDLLDDGFGDKMEEVITESSGDLIDALIIKAKEELGYS